MSRLGEVGGRLYRGEVSINFVDRRRLWYMISGAILLISLVSLLVRGLDLSVEFKGGADFTVTAPSATISQVEKAVTDAGVTNTIVQQVGTGSTATWQVQTKQLTYDQQVKVEDTLASELRITVAKDISI